MFSRVAPIGARVGHDQPDAHEVRFPASARGDLSTQAVFSVECSKQLVDVDQGSLHLDNQQVLGSSMPGELVDDAAFAVYREGHLGLDNPAGSPRDQRSEALREQGMATVEQPIQLAAPPPAYQIEADVQHGSDAPHRCQRQAPAVAALHQRYRRMRDSGRRGHVLLSQLASQSNGPDDSPESLVIHAVSVAWAPLRALICATEVGRRTYAGRRAAVLRRASRAEWAALTAVGVGGDWWSYRDSNPGPPACHAGALPAEL